jgi:RimJ/RimL family protein N-acetyltransferase
MVRERLGVSMAGSQGILDARSIVGTWGALRPLDAATDARAIYNLQHDSSEAATWTEMKVGPFSDADAFATHVEELVADPHRAFFAVTDPSGAPLGWMCLMESQPTHKVIELGYVLFTPPMRRTTLATEAFYLAIAHVFDDLGYRRLEWTCTAQNQPSRKAAERLGFTFEGVHRKKLILKARPRDIAMYAMLAEDWPARREAFQRWLRPANFDNGVQRAPLAL